MEGAFLTVMLIVVGLGVVIAIATLFMGSSYDSIGRGAFSLDEPDRSHRGPAPGSPAAHAEAQEEIRQLVEAKNARREARGQAPLDVDLEIAALTRPAPAAGVDPALREEVRQLVVARNERRARQGKPLLDVDAEIDRQLRDIGG